MKTPLYDQHLKLNGRMVDFNGWDLPLQYSGILDEYWAVRKKSGLFDVSHMLRIDIEGKDAFPFLDYLTTNTLNKPITYSLLPNESGGIVDDTLVYKLADDHFFIVANGSRRTQDFEHLMRYKDKFNVTVSPKEEMILAFQGPETESIFTPLKKHTFAEENGVIRSATGYTGEKGFEFFGPADKLVPLWEELIQKGVKPAGLGARDLLRLEMGYALYGHELTETLKPKETISSWAVKDKNTIGKSECVEWYASGIVLDEPGIPREKYSIYKENENIGYVTSGGFSPLLQKGIALILTRCKLAENEKVAVQIRDKKVTATLNHLPFVEEDLLHN